MFQIWTDFDRTLSDLDRLFTTAPRRTGPVLPTRRTQHNSAANIYENEESFVVVMPLPGVTLDDLEVTVEASDLTVVARRRTNVPEGFTITHRERLDSDVRRTFRFPAAVQLDAVTARLDKGLLQVTVPKSAQARPRTIAVSAG